jgi:hypothetical protein
MSPASPQQPSAVEDVAQFAEAHALQLLALAHRRDVEAITESLKGRLVAGEFSGYDPGPETPDQFDRFSKLVEVCTRHRRASPELARLTFALASRGAREAARHALLEQPCIGGTDDSAVTGEAAYVLAYDVREFAIDRWGAPEDDFFGPPRRRKRARSKK